jgi:hypothetical protein
VATTAATQDGPPRPVSAVPTASPTGKQNQDAYSSPVHGARSFFSHQVAVGPYAEIQLFYGPGSSFGTALPLDGDKTDGDLGLYTRDGHAGRESGSDYTLLGVPVGMNDFNVPHVDALASAILDDTFGRRGRSTPACNQPFLRCRILFGWLPQSRLVQFS